MGDIAREASSSEATSIKRKTSI